jgi:hypothetical protein
MAQKSINKLTNEELNLICSTKYPLLKKSAMGKIKTLFEQIGSELQAHISLELPEYKRIYKISSGENFDNSPYLVLDIPQLKSNNFGFVFRIFFRWGHHFSLQCLFQNDVFNSNTFINELKLLNEDCKILLGSDPWENKHEHSNFNILNELSQTDLKNHINEESWIKISIEFPIKKPEDLLLKATGFYINLIRILRLSSQQGF